MLAWTIYISFAGALVLALLPKGNAALARWLALAVAVAGFLFHQDQLPRTTINVAIISGGNIDPQLLQEITRAGEVAGSGLSSVLR